MSFRTNDDVAGHSTPRGNPPRAPYDEPIRGRMVDRSTGISWRPHEGPINDAVGAFGSAADPHIRRAFVKAFAPQLPEADWPRGETPRLIAQHRGPDWCVLHRTKSGRDVVLASTEHKPSDSNAQWNHGVTVSELLGCPAVRVTATQRQLLSQHSRLLDQQWLTHQDVEAVGGYGATGFKSRKRTGGAQAEWVVPQVISYWVSAQHLEVTPTVAVVADRTSDINALYSTCQDWYQLDPTFFPIFSTPEVLNTLGAELDVSLLGHCVRSELYRLCDALWVRSGQYWENFPLTSAAQQLVSEAALYVASRVDDAEWVPWKEWVTRG